MNKLNLCQCGCGQEVTKEGNRFINRHYSRVRTIEDRKKHQLYFTLNNPMSKEEYRVKRKITYANNRKKTFEQLCNQIDFDVSEIRYCDCGCGVRFICKKTSYRKYAQGHSRKGKTYEEIYGFEDAVKLKEKIIKSLFKTWNKRNLSSYESKIVQLCKQYNLPYKYCGNGSIFIGGKVPDFININGQKIVFEVYSTYHLGNFKPLDYEIRRSLCFKNYGYKVLYFTENDLFKEQWQKHCLDKIKEVENGRYS